MKRADSTRRLFALLAAGALACAAGTATSAGPHGALPFGEGLDGKAFPRLAPPGTHAVVLYFAATDCPISNRYLPEIARLRNAMGTQGVEVLTVYPNPGDTRSVVAAHEHDFGLPELPVLDTQQSLVRLAHARLTPEAAVLVPDGAGWREVYLGRIDDRYRSLGEERPAATRHDLEDAVRAVLAHHPVPAPGGPAVGCGIVPLPA